MFTLVLTLTSVHMLLITQTHTLHLFVYYFIHPTILPFFHSIVDHIKYEPSMILFYSFYALSGQVEVE